MKIFPGAGALAAARARPRRRWRWPSATSTACTSGTRRCCARRASARPRRGGAVGGADLRPRTPPACSRRTAAPPLIMSLERRLELLRRGRRSTWRSSSRSRASSPPSRPTASCARCWRATSARATWSSATTSASAAGARATPRAARPARAAAGPRAWRSIPPVTVDGLPCSSTQGARVRARGATSRAPRRCSAGPFEIDGRGGARRGARARPRLSDRQRRARGRAAARSSASTRRGRAILDGAGAGRHAAHRARSASARNPTFAEPGRRRSTVEAYLLDFDGDLYGRRLRLEIVRPPARRAALRVDRRRWSTQIAADVARGPRVIVLTDVRHRDDGRAVRQAGARRSRRSAIYRRLRRGGRRRRRIAARGYRGAHRRARARAAPRPRRRHRDRRALRVDRRRRRGRRSNGGCRPTTPAPALQILVLRRDADGIETEPRTMPLGAAARPRPLLIAGPPLACAPPPAAWTATRFVPLVAPSRSDRRLAPIPPRVSSDRRRMFTGVITALVTPLRGDTRRRGGAAPPGRGADRRRRRRARARSARPASRRR